MLQELSITDFAIIEEVTVSFTEGLTVLTGETGAGKSILIDAIQLLSGGRGSVEYVRHGAAKAEIEGLFIIEDQRHKIYHVSEQYGIKISDQMVVLRRTISSSGKSICRVNGKLVTLAILREIGSTLIDIHTQHETQSLMAVENHIQLLDTFGSEAIQVQKMEYQRLYKRYKELAEKLKTWNTNEQEMTHRLDLIQFQKRELEDAELEPNEDERLEKESRLLSNFEKINQSLQTAYNALNGEQRGLEWVTIAEQALQEGKEMDPFILKSSEQITSIFYNLEELSIDLRHYADELQFDENRLNDIESRIAEINRLKKKYGSSANEMLEYLAKIDEEIEQIENKDSHVSKLQKQTEDALHDAFLEAKQLHDLRRTASTELVDAIQYELKDLYLEKADFAVEFIELASTELEIEQLLADLLNGKSTLNNNGFDKIQFLISANPGEPLRDLTKVASGGELSRIMLALKKIFAKHQGVTSVIFDEVDTGVSGRVAQAIAEKIYQISNASQVLCITHLPQVAAMSDNHKLITKELEDGRTGTHVHDLSTNDKITELSRMITGSELTETAIKHARELAELAEQFKQNV